MKFLCILALLLCTAPRARAQTAENVPVTIDDLPAVLDVHTARQRVTFPEPVYARMWIEITLNGSTKTRSEVLLPQAGDTITFSAVLWRRDFSLSDKEGDTSRLRIGMAIPLPAEGQGSYESWTSNERIVLPPVPPVRSGAASVSVKYPAERPLEEDNVIMTITEPVGDPSGHQVDVRKVEVKIRFSKSAFQPATS